MLTYVHAPGSPAGRFAALLTLLLVVGSASWPTSVLADMLGPQQNISNDTNQASAPQIAQDPAGNLHAIWASHEGGLGGSDVVRYAKGLWNGASYTFGASTFIADVTGFNFATPSVAVAPNGTLMIGWSESDGLHVQTWDSKQSQPSGSSTFLGVGTESSISPDTANRFHIAWNGNFQIQYCQFENGSCTASATFSSPITPHSPHVAADSRGNVHVVWDQNTGVFYRSRPAGGAFGAYEMLDTGGNRASIAADGQGNVHIVWSSNFVIQYCERAFGQPCSNQHVLQSPSAQDVTPSVGVTRYGTVLVAFLDQQNPGMLWYDTREAGNWVGTRQLAPGPTSPFVSAQPYSNRFSVVWSGNNQIQHIVVTVPAPQLNNHITLPYIHR